MLTVTARNLQIKIGRPSTKDIMRIVTDNLLPNCPITKADILAAENIFGPDLGTLKGKSTRAKPHKVRPILVSIPQQILQRYRLVSICVDLMFVNKVAFLVTISRNIHFGTVEAVPNQQAATLVKYIRSVSQIYRRGGFLVEHALADNQFTSLKGFADIGITVNETGRDDHVGEVERYIRTVKERARCIYNTLPFDVIPPRMVVEMINASVFWLNAFPIASASPQL
jgi:hypothetical protein